MEIVQIYSHYTVYFGSKVEYDHIYEVPETYNFLDLTDWKIFVDSRMTPEFMVCVLIYDMHVIISYLFLKDDEINILLSLII